LALTHQVFFEEGFQVAPTIENQSCANAEKLWTAARPAPLP
jgi:hypothetical protein